MLFPQESILSLVDMHKSIDLQNKSNINSDKDFYLDVLGICKFYRPKGIKIADLARSTTA